MVKLCFIVLGVLSLGLASCGDDKGEGAETMACSSTSLLGTWNGTILGSPDVMTFNSNCNGTSTYCEATNTFPNVITNSGTVAVEVTSTNGNIGCLPLGSTSCLFTTDESTLTFNCGGETLTYTR